MFNLQYLSQLKILATSITMSKPITEARLSSDCFGFKKHRLLRGVAPLRKGESGGRRLSNNSGLS